MAKKYTLQFNWKDTYGWTETFYTDFSGELGGSQVLSFVTRMAAARVGCLTNGAILLACRVSDPAAPSVVRGIELNLPGTAGNGIISTDQTDVVQLSALVNFYSTNGVRRSYLMRGLTDADVVQGKLTFSYSGRGVYNTWWNFVQRNTFIRDVQNDVKHDITAISGAGIIVTPDVAFVPAAGTKLVVVTRVAGNGPAVRSTATVQSSVAGAIRLKRWSQGDCALGTVCIGTPVFVAFSSYSLKAPALVRTRQTGAPLGQLPGRR